jgi:hypothetical protein
VEYKKNTIRTDVRITPKEQAKPVRSPRAGAARRSSKRAASASNQSSTPVELTGLLSPSDHRRQIRVTAASAAGAAAGVGAAATAADDATTTVAASGAATGATTAATTTTATSAIDAMINSWTPPRGFEEVSKVWKEIAPMVRKICLQFEYENPKRARGYLGAVSRHVAARYSAGHRIDTYEVLFSDEALAATLGASVASKRDRGTQQKDLGFLRKIRRVLLPGLYQVEKELEYGLRKIALPYSEREISELFSYARQNKSPKTKHFYATLLLSFAAGFAGRELSNARGSDLISTPWGLIIETQGIASGGNRGYRAVPILAKYEDELSRLAKEFGDDLFLGARLDGQSRDPSRLFPKSENLPSYSTGRARHNWVQILIENEVSFLALRQAGGPVVKERELNFLAADLEPAFDRYVTQIRGGARPFDQSKHLHLLQYAEGQ